MGKTPHAGAGTNFGGNAFNTNGLDQPGVGIAGAAAVDGGGEENVDMIKPPETPETSTVDIRIAMIGNVDRCPGCCMSRGLVREFYSCALSFAIKTFPNP